MVTYRTPDVYVEEISLLPPSVAEVGTAIPAFVGYTEKALRGNQSLTDKPTKIYSLKEYEALFGMPPADAISVTLREIRENNSATGALQGYVATAFSPADGSLPTFLMYWAVKMHFDNGGAQCYVVSVGSPYPSSVAVADLERGLDALELEDEPTLLVVPEAVKLSNANYGTVTQAALRQCGKLKDRFAIIDVTGGDAVASDVVADVDTVRGLWGTGDLKYGAAYYPFVKTSMNFFVDATASNVTVTIIQPDGTTVRRSAVPLSALENGIPASPGDPGATPPVAATPATPPDTAAFNTAKAHLAKFFIGMPPSGAVAGVYAAVDAARGVWKAPANVSLADVIEPMIKLDNLKQDSLNIDTNGGKSVNAIRSFAGKGSLVWGARTLAGNDNEWRYINVRRFFNMVEESVKKSTYWAVFEPNDANTWVKVRGMIESYLTDRWRDGALAGATPKDAFFVKCGLGVTMTAQEILQGRMNVEIGMAVVRPAEFIVLKFSHKMQTS
jgi:phage tail sheath protein FI